jgi:Ankyrin repeats (many copies)
LACAIYVAGTIGLSHTVISAFYSLSHAETQWCICKLPNSVQTPVQPCDVCMCFYCRTLLHYAASANDVEMVRLLVVNGACVLAKTASDHETAEMKCNKTTPGFEECSRYLRGRNTVNSVRIL